MSQLPRRKRFPRLMLIATLLIIILISAIAWNFHTPANDPQVQAIRQQGYPVTLRELDVWYGRIPDDENVALVYTNVFAKIALASNAFNKIKEDSWMPKRGQAIAAEDKAEIAAILATNRETLEPLFLATNLTNCRYPIDLTQGFTTKLSHLSQLKDTVTILVTRGMIEAADGQTDETVRSFLTASRLTHSISQEPLLISQLVECGNWALICRRLEWCLNATTFTPEQLARLQEMLAAAESNSFYRGLVGEQASGYSIFTDPKSQTALLGFGGAFDPDQSPNGDGQLRAQLLFGVLKTTGFFKKDKAFYLHAMSNHIAIAKLPFPERFTVSQNSSFVPPSRFYIISSMILPALSKAATRDATRAANLRVSETALAVERYRRSASNSLPDSLDQLVPAYLPAVAADPFDGKPLRFKRRGEGYVIYSVGSDQRDNDGTERDRKKPTVASDITFILEH